MVMTRCGRARRKKEDDKVEQGKRKTTTYVEDVPQGKEKKRKTDEDEREKGNTYEEGKSDEEATSAHDDKRKNSQLQAAKAEFKAFVKSNDVKPENYVSTLKKFVGQNQMMSSLWAELKRQRQGADLSIQQAWN
ncbi:hypothetical protein N9L68_01380 [bacterium]|nr:hypothetical protein [bacterium]